MHKKINNRESHNSPLCPLMIKIFIDVIPGCEPGVTGVTISFDVSD